jgi:hypothetical protein
MAALLMTILIYLIIGFWGIFGFFYCVFIDRTAFLILALVNYSPQIFTGLVLIVGAGAVLGWLYETKPLVKKIADDAI